MTSTSHTLADEMISGALDVHDALRIGMSLAERLREMHEQGNTHGALSPAAVALEGNHVLLLAAASDPRYAAPEVLQGETADARSDIFSFGTILFEMLNRSAHEGDTALPIVAGHPAADRLMKGCLAKLPDDRFPEV